MYLPQRHGGVPCANCVQAQAVDSWLSCQVPEPTCHDHSQLPVIGRVLLGQFCTWHWHEAAVYSNGDVGPRIYGPTLLLRYGCACVVHACKPRLKIYSFLQSNPENPPPAQSAATAYIEDNAACAFQGTFKFWLAELWYTPGLPLGVE